jgi:hypothetical protein
MSNTEIEQPNTPARKAVNLVLQKDIRAWGEELAKSDHRDLSREVQWLIEQEYFRRNPAANPQAIKAA